MRRKIICILLTAAIITIIFPLSSLSAASDNISINPIIEMERDYDMNDYRVKLQFQSRGWSLQYQLWVDTKSGWYLIHGFDEAIDIPDRDEIIEVIRVFLQPDQCPDDNRYKFLLRIRLNNKIIYEDTSQVSLKNPPVKINYISTDGLYQEGDNGLYYGQINKKITVKVYPDYYNLQYRFLINNIPKSDWLKCSTLNYTPTKKGDYYVTIQARYNDCSSNIAEMTIPVRILQPCNDYPVINDLLIENNKENGGLYIEAMTNSDQNLDYKFTIFENHKNLIDFSDYSNNSSYQSSINTPGTYSIQAWVKDLPDIWYQDTYREDYTIQSNDPAVITSVEYPSPLSQKIDTQINFTINAETKGNNPNLLYCFLLHDAAGWHIMKNYSSSNSWSWTPHRSGNYKIVCRVKDNVSDSYHDQRSLIYTITGDCTEDIEIDDINIEKAVLNSFDYVTNIPLKITGTASGTDNLMYQISIYNTETHVWQTLMDYSPINECLWVPRRPAAYHVILRVKNVDSGSYEKQMAKTIIIDEYPCP